MANHGPTYGFSREMQLKNKARFSLVDAQETLDWIQQTTGIPLDANPYRMVSEDEVGNVLKNGVQLCALANEIMGPGSVKYIKNARMPFHMMENISNFLTAIKKYGVAEISCFQTVDLYEKKQMYKVVECLRALAAVAYKKNAPVPIPPWTVKLSEPTPRAFEPEILNQSATVVSLQYGTNKGASQKGMTPYGLVRQILPDNVPKEAFAPQNGLDEDDY